METNNEIIDKLKGSVSAKLAALDPKNSYDQTLIDYILVMVVNQKSKYEMKHNLALFLGKISDDFVNWLFEYLPKLKMNPNSDPDEPPPKPTTEKKEQVPEEVEPNEQPKEDAKISVDVSPKNHSSEKKVKSNFPEKEPVKKAIKKKKLKSAIVMTEKTREENFVERKRPNRSPIRDEFDFEDDQEESIKTKKPRKFVEENEENGPQKEKVNRSVQVNPPTSDSVMVADDQQQQRQREEEATKFFVTLDGVKNMFKVDDLFLMDEELDPELMAEDSDQLAMMNNKKEKYNKDNNNKFERCRYWPSCLNGKKCDYYHPIIKCNLFPNCRYGSKCLYIHPICKFDSVCSRKDCPFFHTTTKRTPTIVTNNIVCKFYPKCVNPACEFIHPKLCHFGAACKTFNCPFNHPNQNLPHPSKLKWTSAKNNDKAIEIK